MRDVEQSPDGETPYECFECGTIVVEETLTTCPDCGGEMRNRRMPIE